MGNKQCRIKFKDIGNETQVNQHIFYMHTLSLMTKLKNCSGSVSSPEKYDRKSILFIELLEDYLKSTSVDTQVFTKSQSF